MHQSPPGKNYSEDAGGRIGADGGQEFRVQEEGYIKVRLQGIVGVIGEAECKLFLCSYQVIFFQSLAINQRIITKSKNKAIYSGVIKCLLQFG